MSAEPLSVQEEISAFTLKIACPLLWHDKTEAWPKRLDGATCFFLRFSARTIGVTANHVVDAFQIAAAANSNIICQLRNSPAFNLPAAIIARDQTQDIATFTVRDETLSQIGVVALDCWGSWPPPEPQHLWALSVCGFPESMRITRPDRSSEFQAWGRSPL